MTIATILLVISGALLVLTYGGFAAILGAIATLTRPWRRTWMPEPFGEDAPDITVFFSALNEEENVARRLENIFDTDYDPDRIRAIVVSDGSTDATAERTRAYIDDHPERRITLVELPENKGPAHAQNSIPNLADTEIVVSTDAAATFRRDTLPNLIAPFRDPRVSAVGAVVVYQDPGNSSVAYGYAKYRDVERLLRSWESELGVLVKVDGPCVAYRLSIWDEIQPFEDVDQVICLWAQIKGVRAVQADHAICYDWANQTPAQEIKQRARMTRKALLSTFNRWGLRESLSHPGFTAALWLHKLVRFFSPVLVVALAISGLVAFGAYVLAAAAAVGLAAAVSGRLRQGLIAFYWAQVSFFRGLSAWAVGDRSGSYTPTRKVGTPQ